MEEFDNVNFEEKKRPTMLTVLAVLSFIYIGISIISNFFQLIRGPFTEDELYEMKVDSAKQITEMKTLGADWVVDLLEKSQRMIEDLNSNFYLALSITLISFIIGLVGVIMMLKRRKLGFHLYIIYNIIAVGAVFLYASPANVPAFATIFNVIIAALFIFLYSRTLHWLTK